METKQSSIEWLVDELTSLGHNFKLYKKEIEQAKEMHKNEMNECWDEAKKSFSDEEFEK